MDTTALCFPPPAAACLSGRRCAPCSQWAAAESTEWPRICGSLCINVPRGPAPELGPVQTQAEARIDPPTIPCSPHRHRSSISPSIMQQFIPAGRSPHVSPFTPWIGFPLAVPLHSWFCHRGRRALTHSRSESAVNRAVSGGRAGRSHTHTCRTHKNRQQCNSVVWSDRLNRVLIEFRYIFIFADNHYTRYLQSLWNITIGIYRNFVQNMPDFNAWIVGSLVIRFWRTKRRPKSHWCLEVP